jgi:hypothetical protein
MTEQLHSIGVAIGTFGEEKGGFFESAECWKHDENVTPAN